MIQALIALIYALPELITLMARLEKAQDISKVIQSANQAIDADMKADDATKKIAAAQAIADFWANRS